MPVFRCRLSSVFGEHFSVFNQEDAMASSEFTSKPDMWACVRRFVKSDPKEQKKCIFLPSSELFVVKGDPDTRDFECSYFEPRDESDFKFRTEYAWKRGHRAELVYILKMAETKTALVEECNKKPPRNPTRQSTSKVEWPWNPFQEALDRKAVKAERDKLKRLKKEDKKQQVQTILAQYDGTRNNETTNKSTSSNQTPDTDGKVSPKPTESSKTKCPSDQTPDTDGKVSRKPAEVPFSKTECQNCIEMKLQLDTVLSEAEGLRLKLDTVLSEAEGLRLKLDAVEQQNVVLKTEVKTLKAEKAGDLQDIKKSVAQLPGVIKQIADTTPCFLKGYDFAVPLEAENVHFNLESGHVSIFSSFMGLFSLKVNVHKWHKRSDDITLFISSDWKLYVGCGNSVSKDDFIEVPDKTTIGSGVAELCSIIWKEEKHLYSISGTTKYKNLKTRKVPKQQIHAIRNILRQVPASQEYRDSITVKAVKDAIKNATNTFRTKVLGKAGISRKPAERKRRASKKTSKMSADKKNDESDSSDSSVSQINRPECLRKSSSGVIRKPGEKKATQKSTDREHKETDSDETSVSRDEGIDNDLSPPNKKPCQDNGRLTKEDKSPSERYFSSDMFATQEMKSREGADRDELSLDLDKSVDYSE